MKGLALSDNLYLSPDSYSEDISDSEENVVGRFWRPSWIFGHFDFSQFSARNVDISASI